ncbi:AraC family transcriptional regulator [Ruminococcaceae bacterium OttesenSCG-928-L11]|nr:AraC family transcriptional regulator [Ruminococcaceae bacterium OttesenSCG-928-L11]
MSNSFENIQHHPVYPGKVFVTQMKSSRYHWHYDYEILLVLKGTLQVHCGPDPTTLGVGSLQLFNSKSIHGFKHAEGDNLCLFIQLAKGLFEDAQNDRRVLHFYLNTASPKYPTTLPSSHFVRSAAHIGLASREDGFAAALRTRALLHTLAADLVSHVPYDTRLYPSHQQSAEGEMTAAISDYVDCHLHDAGLAGNLCKALGMSEKTIYRYLKTTLGVTLKELIDTARLERSQQLLTDTDKPIGLIAEQCGFLSESTFYRAFKKEMGVTPNEYRSGDTIKAVDGNIQGYLEFDSTEAKTLLQALATSES